MLCLNKDFPAIPKYDRYRPIIISSYLLKSLEGLLMPSLLYYAKHRLHKNQIGFVPGLSIDCAKKRALEIMTELLKNQGDKI